MLTKEQIQKLASDTLKEHGLLLCDYLNKSGHYSAGQLVAILEIFAEKIESARSTEIVAVIDGAMGSGWTRSLAKAIGERP
jgi:hypothetical protein